MNKDTILEYVKIGGIYAVLRTLEILLKAVQEIRNCSFSVNLDEVDIDEENL